MFALHCILLELNLNDFFYLLACLRSKMRSDNLIRGNGHQSSMNNGKKNHSSSSSTSSPHSFMDDEYDIDMDVEPMDDDDDRDLAEEENEEEKNRNTSIQHAMIS